jgi:hypothetical protein
MIGSCGVEDKMRQQRADAKTLGNLFQRRGVLPGEHQRRRAVRVV